MQIEKYKKREKHNVSESTIRSRLSAINKLREFADIGSDEEPTVSDVEEWIDYMIEEYEENNIKASTIKQYYKAVKYYFDKVHNNADEIEHVRDWIPVGSVDHGDYVDKDELEQLLSYAYEYRERAIIEMMYWYARRPSEIILLNMEDVNFEEETIKFPILKKDDKSFRATYEMVPEVKSRIKEYLEYRTPQTIDAEQPWEEGEVEPLFTTHHGRISYSTVWKKIKDIADRAELNKNITPKSMRHSRATHLDWSGENPQIIARQQLMHDPDTTEVISSYIHPREEDDVRDVVREKES